MGFPLVSIMVWTNLARMICGLFRKEKVSFWLKRILLNAMVLVVLQQLYSSSNRLSPLWFIYKMIAVFLASINLLAHSKNGREFQHGKSILCSRHLRMSGRMTTAIDLAGLCKEVLFIESPPVEGLYECGLCYVEEVGSLGKEFRIDDENK